MTREEEVKAYNDDLISKALKALGTKALGTLSAFPRAKIGDVTLCFDQKFQYSRFEKGIVIKVEGVYGGGRKIAPAVSYKTATKADFEKTIPKVKARVAVVQKAFEDERAASVRRDHARGLAQNHTKQLEAELKAMGFQYPTVEVESDGDIKTLKFSYTDARKLMQLLKGGA
jgi:hypothetical protein